MNARRHRTARLTATIVAAAGALVAADESAFDDQYNAAGAAASQRLNIGEARALNLVETISGPDFPLLLIAFGIAAFAIGVAFSLPDLVLWMLQMASLGERAARGISVVLFVAIIGVGAALALSVFDLNVGHQLVALGLVSIALSYGLGVELSNIAAGIFMPLFAPVEVGKTVSINGITGVVTHVNLRYTIVTSSNAERTKTTWIPNHYFTQYPCEEIGVVPRVSGQFEITKRV